MNSFGTASRHYRATSICLGVEIEKKARKHYQTFCLFFLSYSLLFALPLPAFAQVPPGVLPFSTNEYGVDLASGNVNVAFPLRSKSGKIPFWSKLVGTSGMTLPTGYNNWAPTLNLQYVDPTVATIGWQVRPPTIPNCRIGTTTYYAENIGLFTITDSTGASHGFPPIGTTWKIGSGPTGSNCHTQQGTFGPVAASDGSGYLLSMNSGNITVYMPGGTYLTGSCPYPTCTLNSTLYDADGAALTNSGGTVTDTLGTQPLTSSWTYTDANGNNQQYARGYTSLLLASNFSCGSQGPSDFTYSATPMQTSLTLPGTSPAQYSISYEPTPGKAGYYTGRIGQITLPSGGSISYSYLGGNQGLNCAYGTVPEVDVTVNDNNGNSGTYKYVSSLSTSGSWFQSLYTAQFTVTKTDPSGNQTVFNFAGEYQTQAKYYQGTAAGTPVKTVITCYNGNLSNCATPSSIPQVSITETDVFTSFGSGPQSLVQTLYDGFGNVTSEVDMDYGNVGTGGSCTSSTAGVCKKTLTTYGSWNGSGCTALSTLVSLPCDIKVENNNTGAIVAETRYTYSGTGHPTTVSKWISGSTWATANNSYNSNGTLASTTDPNGNLTQYGYSGAGGCNNLLVTSITYPMSSVGASYQAWNCNGGVLTSTTDVNNQTTSYSYSDPFWRLTATDYPDTGSVSTTYQTGSSLPWSSTTTTAINASTSKSVTTQYDGLDRTTEVETSDPGGADTVTTIYDQEGNIHSVSNPQRTSSSPTDGTTSYVYDALNRVVKETEADGNTLQWCYNDIAPSPPVSNCTAHIGSVNADTWVDFTDEAGNHWQRTSDLLGRLTEVVEPNGSSSSPTMETDYAYDPLNNLLTVTQCGATCPASGSRIRTFAYDGLSRTTSASNPESGTSTYAYDADSNLVSTTSPAVNASSGTQTVGYCYDAMNRATYKFYSAPNCTSPSSYVDSFAYDTSSITGAQYVIGRLTDEKAYNSGVLISENSPYKYDVMGRLTAEQQTPYAPNSTSYQFLYGYDLAGNLNCANNGFASVTSSSNCASFTALASTLVEQYSYDSANHLQEANTTVQPSAWSTSTYPPVLLQANATSPAAYDPLGHLVNAQLGLVSLGASAAIQAGSQYDNRGRTTSISDGSLYSYSVPSGDYSGNSNLLGLTDSVTGTWNFGYDTLSRLTSANATSGTYNGQKGCWTYDAFGNRSLEAFSTGTCTSGTSQYTVTTPTSNNQISGFVYDVAGNVLNDGRNGYLYNTDGRLCAAAYPNGHGGTSYEEYFYDAEGRRAGKGSVSSLTCAAPTSSNGFALSNEYLLGMSGGQVTELNGSGTIQHTNVFAGGGLLATYDFVNGGLHFALTDPLGTKRVQADVTGTGSAAAELNCFNLPFGNDFGNTYLPDCWPVGSGGSPSTEHFFTGKERDSESGNDYFVARYYASSVARFFSPDPSELMYADLGNPQSLNLYAYVTNRPLVMLDPSGLADCSANPKSATEAMTSNGIPDGGCLDGNTLEQIAADNGGLGGVNNTPNIYVFQLYGWARKSEGGCFMSDPECRLQYEYLTMQISAVRDMSAPTLNLAPNNGGDYNGNSPNYWKRKPTGQCSTILSNYEGAADKVNAKGWVGFWGPTMTGAALGGGGILSMGKAFLLGILNGAAWSAVTDDSRSQINSLYNSANSQWQAAGCGSSMYNKYD